MTPNTIREIYIIIHVGYSREVYFRQYNSLTNPQHFKHVASPLGNDYSQNKQNTNSYPQLSITSLSY